MELQGLQKGLRRANTRIAYQIEYRTVCYGTEVRYRSVPMQYRKDGWKGAPSRGSYKTNDGNICHV
jgi:hypothetical protein